MPVVNSTETSTPRTRWFWVGGFVAFWTALALLASAEIYVAQLHWDKPVSWKLALTRSFKEFYSYAVLSLAVLWLCKRWLNLTGLRWFAAHMAAALVLALAH